MRNVVAYIRNHLSSNTISAALALLVASAFIMASMPNFIQRFFRPLTSSTRLGISGDASSGPISRPEGSENATIAAGCFWGVEHLYRKHFGDKGLYDARVGYTAGQGENPTYEEVCSGKTGHSEALLISYNPSQLSYRQILEFFYRMHDPTTANRQGPDVGTQYRSGIYYHNPEQEKIAKEVTAKVNEQWYDGKVATEVKAAGKWWDAEDYHQEYLIKQPWGYECPSHFLRTFPDLK